MKILTARDVNTLIDTLLQVLRFYYFIGCWSVVGQWELSVKSLDWSQEPCYHRELSTSGLMNRFWHVLLSSREILETNLVEVLSTLSIGI